MASQAMQVPACITNVFHQVADNGEVEFVSVGFKLSMVKVTCSTGFLEIGNLQWGHVFDTME
jgi:uncharacterized pyridoxamine 5'-phosphate oxidase family protein